MGKQLKITVITLLVGIAGALMVTASQRYPASEVRADTTDAFHVRLSHPTEGELHSNKSSEYMSQEISAFIELIDELPLYNIFIAVTSISLALLLYRLLFKPIELIREFGDVGYITDGGRNKKEVAEEVYKRKAIRSGNVPPVYPNGWFSVALSFELKKGGVKYVQALGQDFVIFRGEDGNVYALNAFCTHLGANLGVGGKVKGDCIQCPFEGWTFRGSDGKCIDIGKNDKKVPDNANTRAWACREVDQMIFIWYHAEGINPDWVVIGMEDIKTGYLKYHGYSTHIINAHIEEITENGADFAHFGQLHGPFFPVGRDVRYRFQWLWSWIQFAFHGDWHQEKDNKHIGILDLIIDITLFGYKMQFAQFPVTASQIGPGLVRVEVANSLLGNICYVQSVTPLEPQLQKVTHLVYTSALIIRPLAKFFLWGEAFQLERDMMVWNYKTFQSKPILVKEENIIGKHRRWYSQFFSENSPRYAARKDGFQW